MVLDEEQLQDLASRTSLTDAQASAEACKTAVHEADAALDGLRVELDTAIEKHQRLAAKRARRATEGRAEKADHVQKYFKGSSNTSTAEAAAAYTRIANEDNFLSDVLTVSQGAIDTARAAVAAGELLATRADLQYQEAAVTIAAIKHLAAAAVLQETDPEIVVPFGPAIAESLDRIAEATVALSRKEKEFENGKK